VRTERARVHIGRALAKHDPNAVPLGQSPIRRFLPTDVEAVRTSRKYRELRLMSGTASTKAQGAIFDCMRFLFGSIDLRHGFLTTSSSAIKRCG
jgi:hypothetical protein